MFSFITGLFGIGKQYLENKKEEKKEKHNLKMQGIKNRARLLQDTQTNNAEWEMRVLENKDMILQRLSFLMFSMPFIVAMFKPELVKSYFDIALASMPEWYIQIFVAIIGGVWGLAELKNGLPGILSAIKNNRDKK